MSSGDTQKPKQEPINEPNSTSGRGRLQPQKPDLQRAMDDLDKIQEGLSQEIKNDAKKSAAEAERDFSKLDQEVKQEVEEAGNANEAENLEDAQKNIDQADIAQSETNNPPPSGNEPSLDNPSQANNTGNDQQTSSTSGYSQLNIPTQAPTTTENSDIKAVDEESKIADYAETGDPVQDQANKQQKERFENNEKSRERERNERLQEKEDGEKNKVEDGLWDDYLNGKRDKAPSADEINDEFGNQKAKKEAEKELQDAGSVNPDDAKAQSQRDEREAQKAGNKGVYADPESRRPISEMNDDEALKKLDPDGTKGVRFTTSPDGERQFLPSEKAVNRDREAGVQDGLIDKDKLEPVKTGKIEPKDAEPKELQDRADLLSRRAQSRGGREEAQKFDAKILNRPKLKPNELRNADKSLKDDQQAQDLRKQSLQNIQDRAAAKAKEMAQKAAKEAAKKAAQAAGRAAEAASKVVAQAAAAVSEFLIGLLPEIIGVLVAILIFVAIFSTILLDAYCTPRPLVRGIIEYALTDDEKNLIQAGDALPIVGSLIAKFGNAVGTHSDIYKLFYGPGGICPDKSPDNCAQGGVSGSSVSGSYGSAGNKVSAAECAKLKEYKAFIEEAASAYNWPAPFIGAILSQETEVGLGGSINPKGCEGRGDTGGRGHGLGQVDQASGAFGKQYTNAGPIQFPVGTKLVKDDGSPLTDKAGKQLTWSDCRDNIMYVAYHLDEVRRYCKNDLKSKGAEGSATFLKAIADGYNRWCGGVKNDNITAKRDGLPYGTSVINRAADVVNCFSSGGGGVAKDNIDLLIDQLAEKNSSNQTVDAIKAAIVVSAQTKLREGQKNIQSTKSTVDQGNILTRILSSFSVGKLLGGVDVEAFNTKGPVIDQNKTHVKSEELAKAFETGAIPTFLSSKEAFAKDAREGLEPGLVNYLLQFAKPAGLAVTALSVNTHRYKVGDVESGSISNHSYGASVDINVGDSDAATAAKVGKTLKDAENAGIVLHQWGYATQTTKAAAIQGGAPAGKSFSDSPGHLHLDFKGSGAGTGSSSGGGSVNNAGCVQSCGEYNASQAANKSNTNGKKLVLSAGHIVDAGTGEDMGQGGSYNLTIGTRNYSVTAEGVANYYTAQALLEYGKSKGYNIDFTSPQSDAEVGANNDAAQRAARGVYFDRLGGIKKSGAEVIEIHHDDRNSGRPGLIPPKEVADRTAFDKSLLADFGDYSIALSRDLAASKRGIGILEMDKLATSTDVGKAVSNLIRSPSVANAKIVQDTAKNKYAAKFFASFDKATKSVAYDNNDTNANKDSQLGQNVLNGVLNGVDANAQSASTVADKRKKLTELFDAKFIGQGPNPQISNRVGYVSDFDDNMIQFLYDLYFKLGITWIGGPLDLTRGYGDHRTSGPGSAIDFWGFARVSEVGGANKPLGTMDGGYAPLPFLGPVPGSEGNKSDPRIKRHIDLFSSNPKIAQEATDIIFTVADAAVSTGAVRDNGVQQLFTTDKIAAKLSEKYKGKTFQGHTTNLSQGIRQAPIGGTNGHHNHIHIGMAKASSVAYKGINGVSAVAAAPCTTAANECTVPASTTGYLNKNTSTSEVGNLLDKIGLGSIDVNAAYGSKPTSYSDITSKTGYADFLKTIAEERGYVAYKDAGKENAQMRTALNAMIAAARNSGITLNVNNTYRSYNNQVGTYFAGGGVTNPITKYWSTSLSAGELADAKAQYLARGKVSAPPGYSEHSTGLALDFEPVADGFASNPGYAWLKTSAKTFGFVESYPTGSTKGAGYEPWHWRFDGNTAYPNSTPLSSFASLGCVSSLRVIDESNEFNSAGVENKNIKKFAYLEIDKNRNELLINADVI